MGAISIDIHKREREFEDLTLSDTNVVKYLILFRSKVDVIYSANVNIDIYQAGDTFDFNQELIALYASLDEAIEQCKFKEKQSNLLKLIFEGNKIQDIIKGNEEYKSSATYDLFDRMVLKIVKVNKANWVQTMRSMGYKK